LGSATLTPAQFINDSATEGMGLRLSWHTDPITLSNGSSVALSKSAMGNGSTGNGSSDVPMSDGIEESTKLAAATRKDVGEMEQGDLDVAEDDDRWMR
jgi:hypothetical protein